MQQPKENLGIDDTSADPRPKRSFGRWLRVALVVLISLALIQLAVIFGRVALLGTSNPSTTAYIRQYLSRCLQEKGDCRLEQTWKPLGEISLHLQEAVLIGEDDAFFEHEGIDPEAIRESLELNLKKNKIVRGGSTITQQLAKNLYLSPSKNPYRKLKEILISLFMEKMLTKQRILEIYLNVIEWGKGIYGAEAASRFYFNKPASALSQDEAAFLAAIIPNPQYLTDPAHSKRALRRKAIILQRMQRRSYPDLTRAP